MRDRTVLLRPKGTFNKRNGGLYGVSSSLSHLSFGLFDGKATEQEFVECIKKKLSKAKYAKTDPVTLGDNL